MWYVMVVVTFMNLGLPPETYHNSRDFWDTKEECLDDLPGQAQDFMDWFGKAGYGEAKVQFSCEPVDTSEPA